jgi:CDP-glucose 4,6-dehydratase
MGERWRRAACDLKWDRIVPGTIRSLLRGERPIIRSDGVLRRDCEAFNFGQAEAVAVRNLVEEIARAVGRTDLAPVVRSRAPNEIPAQWLDTTKARTHLGWAPAFTLPQGLGQPVEWYPEVPA